MRIPINAIEIGTRLRPLNSETADKLVKSIETQGLLHPIGVRGLPDGKYKLLYGLHRLEAFKRLGCSLIEAREGDDLEQRITIAKNQARKGGASPEQIDGIAPELFDVLAEIDENLCRENLDPVLFEAHVARRLKIFQALHPEATKAGSQAKATKAAAAKRDAVKTGETPQAQVKPTETTTAFVTETAAATGKSQSSIKHAISRASVPNSEKLSGKNTTGQDRDAIAKMHKEDPEAAQEVITQIANDEAAQEAIAKVKEKE